MEVKKTLSEIVNQAEQCMIKGKFEKAEELFSEALEINEDYIPAYNHRGLARLFIGKYKEAIDDFKEIIKSADFAFDHFALDIGKEYYLELMGIASLLQDDDVEAIGYFKAAIATFDCDRRTFLRCNCYLGEIEQKNDYVENASKHFLQVLNAIEHLRPKERTKCTYIAGIIAERAIKSLRSKWNIQSGIEEYALKSELVSQDEIRSLIQERKSLLDYIETAVVVGKNKKQLYQIEENMKDTQS